MGSGVNEEGSEARMRARGASRWEQKNTDHMHVIEQWNDIVGDLELHQVSRVGHGGDGVPDGEGKEPIETSTEEVVVRAQGESHEETDEGRHHEIGKDTDEELFRRGVGDAVGEFPLGDLVIDVHTQIARTRTRMVTCK